MTALHNSPTTLETSALTSAAPIVLALQECSPELREEAIMLFGNLASGQLDASEYLRTVTLLAEILFPNTDAHGLPGLELLEAERIAPSQNPEAQGVLDDMNAEEATFATRLQSYMTERGWTQVELAEKVGLGQPAISMMLQRNCRPQKKTILRFAEAFQVEPVQLWPTWTA
jgi:lambda repressor-like predicted transcriptional regulator